MKYIIANEIINIVKTNNITLYEELLKNITNKILCNYDSNLSLIEIYKTIGNKLDDYIVCLDMIDFISKEEFGKYQYEIDAYEECKKCDIHYIENKDCTGCEYNIFFSFFDTKEV